MRNSFALLIIYTQHFFFISASINDIYKTKNKILKIFINYLELCFMHKILFILFTINSFMYSEVIEFILRQYIFSITDNYFS